MGFETNFFKVCANVTDLIRIMLIFLYLIVLILLN